MFMFNFPDHTSWGLSAAASHIIPLGVKRTPPISIPNTRLSLQVFFRAPYVV
jgi:hypothetical protein